MKLQLANHADVLKSQEGVIDSSAVRRTEIEGVVDSGATRLVLPTAVADQLGLPRIGKVGVRYADGRRGEKDVVGEVDLTLLGRNGVYNASLKADRDTALIGAIVLEDLDFLVDCTHGTIRPRDPDMILSEIE